MKEASAAAADDADAQPLTTGRDKFLTSSDLIGILLVVLFIVVIAKEWWMPEVEQLSEHATQRYSAALTSRGIKSISFADGLLGASLKVEREDGSVDVCGPSCDLHESAFDLAPLARFEVSGAPSNRLKVQANVYPDKQSFDAVRDRFDRAMGVALSGIDEYQKESARRAESWATPAQPSVEPSSAARASAPTKP